MRRIENIIIIIVFILFVLSCKNNNENISIEDFDYVYIDQDGNNFNFNKKLKDKYFLLSFMFTHCPDICPLTTHHIATIQDKLKKENIKNFNFITISFDPNRDTPEILSKYIYDRDYNTTNWTFLTGNKKATYHLFKKLNYFAISQDTTIGPDKDTSYYFMHTDRLFLVNCDFEIVKSFIGSQDQSDEIIKEIKKMGVK